MNHFVQIVDHCAEKRNIAQLVAMRDLALATLAHYSRVTHPVAREICDQYIPRTQSELAYVLAALSRIQA